MSPPRPARDSALPGAVPSLAGLAWLALAAASYGGLWPVMRLTVTLMDPFWFAVARLALGSVFVFTVLAVTGRLRRPQRADLPAVLSIGVFMMGIYVSTVHVAVQYVPAGRGALLAYSTPLWVTPVSVLFMGERLTPLKVVGLALGLAGLVVLFNPQSFDWSDSDTLLGNGLCLAAAMSWSVAILHMRVHRWNLSPLQLAPWQLALATVIALPFAAVFGGAPTAAPSVELFLLVAYGGIMGTGIAVWAAQSAMRALSSVTVTIGLLAGPAIALAISVGFLGEMLTWSLALGLVLIVSGLAAVTLAQSLRG